MVEFQDIRNALRAAFPGADMGPVTDEQISRFLEHAMDYPRGDDAMDILSRAAAGDDSAIAEVRAAAHRYLVEALADATDGMYPDWVGYEDDLVEVIALDEAEIAVPASLAELAGTYAPHIEPRFAELLESSRAYAAHIERLEEEFRKWRGER